VLRHESRQPASWLIFDVSQKKNMNLSINELPGLLAIPGLFVALFVLQCVVTLVLAFAVKNDAENLRRSSSLFLVGPWIWFLVVILAGGYLPSVAYWLIHYSSLRFRREERAGQR
jgi:hypothetical protein